MNDLFGLAGPGGLGRGVMPIMRRTVRDGAELCFVDRDAGTAPVNGHEVMAEAAFLSSDRPRWFNIAISDSRVRERLAARYAAARCRPRTIACASAMFLDDNEIGEGAIFCGYAMVTSNVRIGRFFHANIHSYVEHDCVIGDFVTFAPGVRCNGNVRIEDHAYIGAGAMLRNGVRGNPLVIGAGAVIGMGAVVTKSVAEGAVVAGNPARPLATRGG